MRRVMLIVFGAVLVSVLYVGAAQAQATRTWVSGVGDDVNPCSRTAPCKTFAGAISKTATDGEINCLDPGGFGALTIGKAITINCENTLGSVLVSGVNGITVNTPAGAGVTLRSEEHTSELQSPCNLVCRLLLEKKKKKKKTIWY